jgi:hypothetical protein
MMSRLSRGKRVCTSLVSVYGLDVVSEEPQRKTSGLPTSDHTESSSCIEPHCTSDRPSFDF